MAAQFTERKIKQALLKKLNYIQHTHNKNTSKNHTIIVHLSVYFNDNLKTYLSSNFNADYNYFMEHINTNINIGGDIHAAE